MSGSPVYTRWEGCVDLRRALHVQGFVRTLVVEDIHELVGARLLLKKIGGGRLGGLPMSQAAQCWGVCHCLESGAVSEGIPAGRARRFDWRGRRVFSSRLINGVLSETGF